MVKKLLPRGPRDLLWQIILFCGAMEHLYGPAVLKMINVGKG